VTTSTTLWYVARGRGVVALLLLTSSVVLGVLTATRVRTERWPRFAVASLHRNLTLLALAFIGLHIVTVVGDSYVPIGLKDAVVPFVSPYRPLWLGLGAVAFDLLLALVITSWLRKRIGWRIWRGVHWLAYASWPVALVHALGTGSDARTGWLFLLGAACVAAVAASVLARVAMTPDGTPAVRTGGGAAAIALPLLVFVWYQGGPARHGWAARAGTPTHLLASRRHRATVSTPTVLKNNPKPPRSFTSSASGTVSRGQHADGSLLVDLHLHLDSAPRGALRIDLHGVPFGGGVSMDSSGVSFVPATTRAVYYGSVTGLDGDRVWATVQDAAGDRLALTVNLALNDAAGTATATVDATSAASAAG
jgi:methionine sulfoxide reductase heme-binding subunit